MILTQMGKFIQTVAGLVNNDYDELLTNGKGSSVLKSASTAMGNTGMVKGSITRAVEDSVAYYPVIISSNISADNQIELGQINESRVAEYIRIIIETTDTTLDLAVDGNVGLYMNRFKSNGESSLRDGHERINESELSSIVHHMEMEQLFQEEFHPENDTFSLLTEEMTAIIDRVRAGRYLSEAPKRRAPRGAPKGWSRMRQSGQDALKAREDINNRDRVTHKVDAVAAKRANNLTPTIMTANINVMGKDGRASESTVLLGIKSNIHPAPGRDLMDALYDHSKSGNFITRFIKWYSGELSFFRDVVLDADNIKKEQTIGKDSGASLIKKLFAISRNKRAAVSMGKDMFLPTSTLVVSVDDVDYLTNISNGKLDLMNERHARHQMDRLALMTIIVVDEINDVGFIFDDGKYTAYTSFRISTEKARSERNNNKMMQKFLSNTGR